MSNIAGSAGFDILFSFLKENSIAFKKDFLLKYETYFKKGGVAAFYVMPGCSDEVVRLVGFLREHSIPWKFVGLTSNVFFLDELDYGVVITTKNLTRLNVQGNKFEVDCGYSLQDFVRAALIHGKGGLEGLEGVPGSLGGALFMNAGAYGYTISDCLISVTAISPEGELVKLEKQQCEFENRCSLFKRKSGYVIISALFELDDTDRKKSARIIEVLHIARHSYQEFSYPNLGSMFSVRGDFYKEFFSGSRFYGYVCFLLKLLLKNPVVKFFARKRPSNKRFNSLALSYMGSVFSGYSPSVKSMNILVNDGCASLDDILNYISVVRSHLSPDTAIENELVIFPADLTTPKAREILSEIHKKGLSNEYCIDNNSLG